MCGRYYVDDSTERKVQELTHNSNVKLKIGDVHPSETATILDLNGKELAAQDMEWGFPGYRGGGRLINARSETILDKDAFKDSVVSRRCVIPARKFYEWTPQKEQYQFEEPGQTLFMAGCYNIENRFVIITTEANKSVRPVHERMPLLITEDEIERWLGDDQYMPVILRQTPALLEREAVSGQMSMFDEAENSL